jgi:hypothetical protein
MPRIILFVCIICFPHLSGAQKCIEGKITSATDNSFVPYASVYLKGAKIGVYSNAEGSFKLCYPDSAVNDTLVIEHLNYLIFKAPLANSKTEYKLRPVTLALNEVVITGAKGRLESPGKVNNKISGFQYSSTRSYYQVARWIPLAHLQGKKVKLKSIHYFVSAKGKYKAPFRVRLYAKNDSTGMPGADLLTSQVIIQAKKKNAWLTANLDSLNIILPADGVFPAMEWLPVYEEYKYNTYDGRPCNNCYGQVLGLSGDEKNYQHIVRSDLSEWRDLVKLSRTPVPVKTSPMIYIEVEVFD